MHRPQIPAIVAAVAAAAACYGWAVFALTPTHPGSIGLNLNALGTDWMVFYGGARWFFDGQLAQLFDGERFTAYLNAAFSGWLSAPTAFRPWVYPPNYLLVVLPFGQLPFLASYIVFQFATAAMLAAALWYATERPHTRIWIVAAALLGPAAALNAGMGQNAFLTAALLIGGFQLLRDRPALCGAMLGLLTIKPQFWLLVPVALAAARAWKALAWSALAAAALVLASAAIFGIDSWRQWIDLAQASYADPTGKWVALGRLWGDSIYACLVSGGAGERLANTLQMAGTLTAIGVVYAAFRLPISDQRRIAVLLAAAFIAAPHSSLADLVLPASAAALWIGEAAETDTPLAQWTLALAVWLSPLVNPPLISPIGRLTPLLVLGFVAMILSEPLRAAGWGRTRPNLPRRVAAGGSH